MGDKIEHLSDCVPHIDQSILPLYHFPLLMLHKSQGYSRPSLEAMSRSSALYTGPYTLVLPRDSHSVVVDHLSRPAQDKALHTLDVPIHPV